MSETDECSGDAAAYVLGALEPEEAERIPRHLASCVICRDEVAAFQQAVEALPMAAPAYPVPRALRRRVLASGASRSRARPRATARPRSGVLCSRASPLALAFSRWRVLVRRSPWRLSPCPRRLQWHAGRSGDASPRPPGSAQLRLSGGHAELIVRNLPPPPVPGRSTRSGSTRAGGAVADERALRRHVDWRWGRGRPGDLHGVSEVLVTPEPAGGSRARPRAGDRRAADLRGVRAALANASDPNRRSTRIDVSQPIDFDRSSRAGTR